jgi:hypothetical protein
MRDGKGMEERATMLPASFVVPLQEHFVCVKHRYAHDGNKRYGSDDCPCGLERKSLGVGRVWLDWVNGPRWPVNSRVDIPMSNSFLGA